MDFAWPLNTVWGGYINPFSSQSTKCPHCENGHTEHYSRLESLWYSHLGGGFRPEMRGSEPFLPDDELVVRIITAKVNREPRYYGTDAAGIRREAVRMCEIWNSSWSHHLNEQDVAALIEANRLVDFTSVWTPGEGWKPKDPPYVPTPREVNDWSLSGFGHDSCNCWIVIKAELARLGLPSTCDHCEGSGKAWPNEEIRKQSEEWKESEPPAGEGFQLWETTTEGSPQSPVFETLDALCEWAEGNATTFGSNKTTAARWKEMLEEDFVRHEEGGLTFI